MATLNMERLLNGSTNPMRELSIPSPFDDFPEDQLGAEAMVHLPDSPPLPDVTPRQHSRLQGFEHLMGQIDRYDQALGDGRTLHWGAMTPEGKVYETHLVIDRPQVDRMRRMAFGMYDSDLARQPVTRDIANDILYGEKEGEVEPMGRERFSELWETE